jgi:hypothetical protein
MTLFRWYRGRRVPFSCFALSESFSAVPRASEPFFRSCAPGLVFSGTKGVRSLFHVLRSRNYFRRCRVCWVPFSCFALPDLFSVEPRASYPIFMFCAPGLIFGGTEGVGPIFMFCAPEIIFGGIGGVVSLFMFCAPVLDFDGTEGVGSCFALTESFSAVPRSTGPF